MNYTEKRVLYSTAAARNIELGFIPSFVEIWNEDRTVGWSAPLNTMFAFDGGAKELAAGDEIASVTATTGVETGAYGVIEDIFLTSGSWAGGNAEGVIVLSLEGQGGSWAGKNNQGIRVRPQKGAKAPLGLAALNSALINGATEKGNVTKFTSALAAGGTNETIVPYRGESGEDALGITIGSAIAAADKLLIIRAFKHGQG